MIETLLTNAQYLLSLVMDSLTIAQKIVAVFIIIVAVAYLLTDRVTPSARSTPHLASGAAAARQRK